MPYYQRLVEILRVAPHRVTEAGEIQLTDLEARLLRSCDFVTAVASLWKIPPLPEILVRANALPLHLTGRTITVPPTRVAQAIPPAVSQAQVSDCEPSQVIFDGRQEFAILPRPLKGEAERIRAWFTHSATPDQRRVFLSLARCPEGRVRKRSLQQRLHRIPSSRFNEALQALVSVGKVTKDGRTVALPDKIRTAVVDAGLLVSRPRQVRAVAGGRKRTDKRRPRVVCYRTRDGRSRVQPMFVKNRRTLPPVGTSAWGRSMLAKRGGYARYRKCLALGIHPTAQATAARLARKRTQAKAQTTVAGPTTSSLPRPTPSASGRYRRL